MKRIQVVDWLRGLAILIMLFFHSSYYWGNIPSKNQMNQILSNPVAGLTLLIAKAAGIFAIITGMSNALSMYNRASAGKSKPLHIIVGSFITGLWVILIGKIQVGIFNHTMIGDLVNPYPEGPPQYTLIIGSMQTGQLQLPNVFTMVYRTSALFIIGLSIICTGTVVGLLCIKEGHKKVNRNLILMGILATTIILITEPMKKLLRPIWYDAYLNKEHVKGAFYSILIGDIYPLFPFVGYALYGGMFGIAFSQNISHKKVVVVGTSSGLAYLTSGSVLLGIYGNPDISEVNQTLPNQWSFIQVGALILLCTGLYRVHHASEENKIRKTFQSTFVRRFGLVTLTIFVFEPLIGNSIKILILDNIFPNWSNYGYLAFIYGSVLILLWFVILKLWEKVEFKGTLEWLNGKVTSFLTRRDASRLNIMRNLYGDIGVSEVEIVSSQKEVVTKSND